MSAFGENCLSLVGRRVRLGRGGPDERKGLLMAVREDYLAVYSDDGEMVYCPMHHLKSVTEMVGSDTTGQGQQDPPVDEIDGLPDDFHGLMGSLYGRKVQVYDHGPEKTSGFVFEVGNDFVKLVTSPDEMVHYPFFHIRSVRLAKAKSKDDGKDGSGKDGSGKDGSGKDGSGKDGSGKDGSGKDGSGKGRSSGNRKNRGRSGGRSSGGGRGRSSGGGRGRSSGGGRGRSSGGGRSRSSGGGRSRSSGGGRGRSCSGGRSSGKSGSGRKSSRKHS